MTVRSRSTTLVYDSPEGPGAVPPLDLCMWTLNSSRTLETTLQSIDRAIPASSVHHKIAVDGGSRDNTVDILKRYGWEAWPSKPGIPIQANLALSKVDTEYFACFEHDVIIPPNFLEILARFRDPRVIGVTGFRTYEGSPTMRAINLYAHVKNKASWNYSIDNTVLRTDRVRELGGFPYDCLLSADSLLRSIAMSKGYMWLVDENIRTKHLRTDFISAVKHDQRNIIRARIVWFRVDDSQKMTVPWHRPLRILRIIWTPIVGAKIAAEYHAPWAFPGYPFMRYSKDVLLFHFRAKMRPIKY